MLVALVVMSAISGFNNVIVSSANAEYAKSLELGLLEKSYQEDEKDYDNVEVVYPDNYGKNQEGYSSYNDYGSSEYGSYGDSYNNIGYDEGNTYSDYGTYYPPEKPDKKKFTCPDTGIIVDKEENCPVVCPPGSLLEGQLAVPGSDLEQICNFPDVEICADDTQLAGLLVADTDQTNDGQEEACSPFDICPEGTVLEGVAVLDDRDPTTPLPEELCTLNGLEKCPDGTPQEGHFVMGDGNLATNGVDPDIPTTYDSMLAEICNADGDGALECPADTDLGGVLVKDLANCELNVCPDGTALEGVALSDEQFAMDTNPDDGIPDICTLNGLEKCPAGTPQAGHFVMGDGDLSTTVPDDTMLTRICNADGDGAEICPERTDLAGVLVENAPEDCSLNVCPAGTALAGVALSFAQFNTDLTGPAGEPDGIPDICTVNGLEKCPADTIYGGFFVMGDGDPLTTVPEDEMLTALCIPTAKITVTKTTTCDVEEFGEEFCEGLREHKISVLGNNPIPSFFFGTPDGQMVFLGAGAYHVDEAGFTEGLEPCKTMGFDGGRHLGGDIFMCTNFSDDCQGEIMAGEELICDITNTVIKTENGGDGGDKVCVAWDENLQSEGNDEIMVSCSADGGMTFFDEPVNVSQDEGDSRHPDIVVNGNNVYVVWQDGTGEILFSKSTDMGVTWSIIGDNISNTADISEEPEISVAANGNIIVVWEENNQEIFVAISDDQGETFRSPTTPNDNNLSDNTGESLNPMIKVSGNIVVVAWEDKTPGNFDIFVAVSIDGGENFSSPTGGADISDDGTSESKRPQIAISGSNIVVVWDEDKDQIKAAISTDSGANFDPPIPITADDGIDTINAYVAISGSNIVIVYQDKAGNGDIEDIFAWVRDISGGAVTLHNLSDNDTLSDEPKIAVTGGNVIVVWQDSGNGGIDLFVRTSVDNGNTFLSADNISNSGTVQSTVANDISNGQEIVAVGSNVFVTWEGIENGNDETLFNKSTDGGVTFLLDPPANLSEILGTGNSQHQDISAQ
jgi:hypothetical protein